jgi:hypothetical protein
VLIILKPQKGYFEFDLECGWAIEMEYPKNPRCSINGSPLLTAEEAGKVIHALVLYAREHGCAEYEYVDLAKGVKGEKRRCRDIQSRI